MTRDEIEPMVPVMPRSHDTDETVYADGGHRKRYEATDVTAPLVPDLR